MKTKNEVRLLFLGLSRVPVPVNTPVLFRVGSQAVAGVFRGTGVARCPWGYSSSAEFTVRPEVLQKFMRTGSLELVASDTVQHLNVTRIDGLGSARGAPGRLLLTLGSALSTEAPPTARMYASRFAS